MIGFSDLNNVAQGVYMLVICSVIAIVGVLFWITQNLARNNKWKSSTVQLIRAAIVLIAVVMFLWFIFYSQMQY